jgi:hypothetical protein
MHIQRVEISNIKGLRSATLEFGAAPLAGWHVVLGDNGSGKTTIIRAIAAALVGPQDVAGLRVDWEAWFGPDMRTPRVEVWPAANPTDDPAEGADSRGGGEAQPKAAPQVSLELWATRSHPSGATGAVQVWGGVHVEGAFRPPRAPVGWFSAAFGPSRSFADSGGDYRRIFDSSPRVARHISAFREHLALRETELWVVDLQRDGRLDEVNAIRSFLNVGDDLPHGLRLQAVSNRELRFLDGPGAEVPLAELSGGAQSVLGLALELLRQMAACWGGLLEVLDPTTSTVRRSGVVLIDEVDAHLHPSWQATIGAWLTARFPQVQFVVSTHSPLVCRAIRETGRVFRLRPAAQGGDQVEAVSGTDRDILWLGGLEQALESAAFQLDLGMSPAGVESLARYRALRLAGRERDLNDAERAELQRLRAVHVVAGV